MGSVGGLLLLLGTLFCLASRSTGDLDQSSEKSRMQRLENVVKDLSRQVMLQQLFVEERVRSDGSSGLKQVRLDQHGPKSYYSNSFSGSRLAAIHDHANNIRTSGLGELIVVMNGVEFRTRHNDYKLVMPATTRPNGSISYDEVVDVPYPAVPPSVTGTVEEQVREMREWFRAWADQDYSVRDYRPYFKPILCYLEAAWTVSDQESLDESFDSDRHSLDAKSWFDLQEKIRFSSYSGRKNINENYAYLPTTIMKVEDGIPQLAQWNYRIICHPMKKDLPLNRMYVVDDLHVRMAYSRNLSEHRQSRGARFKVAPVDKDRWKARMMKNEFMDKLMGEIPGKDGYNVYLEDVGLDTMGALNFNQEKLNAGYYNRWFRGSRDAMGAQTQSRGFADENAFMALTTQSKVAPIEAENCVDEVCRRHRQRWTYAIPLEIIYLTPLHNWDPYGIEYKGKVKRDVLYAPGIDGKSSATALNATVNTLYYRTPRDFFVDPDSGEDQADTSNDILWIKDSNGTPRQVVASGIRIQLPQIAGMEGKLRTRYPIMPIHTEGSPEWKELEALKDIVLQPKKYDFIFAGLDENKQDEVEMLEFILDTSMNDGAVLPHRHEFSLDWEELLEMKKDRTKVVEVVTSDEQAHSHVLYVRIMDNGLIYQQCDRINKKWTTCWDLHPRKIYMSEELHHRLFS